MADWLIEETELYYAPEMYNEIDRDTNRQRAIRTKQFLSNFVEAKHDVEQAKQIADELSVIIQGKQTMIFLIGSSLRPVLLPR